jgi:hypothetical protein
MTEDEIERRIANFGGMSVDTFVGNTPDWIRKLPEDYYGPKRDKRRVGLGENDGRERSQSRL